MKSLLKSLCRGRQTSPRACGLLITAGALALSVHLVAADATPKTPPPIPSFRQLAPLASVQAAAQAAQIALDGIAPPVEQTILSEGDTVTALVSLTSGAKLQQWLIALTAVQPTEKEKQQRDQAIVFHTSSGHELRFESEPAALAIQSIGPLTGADAGRKASTASTVKRARTRVAADFLALGLDRPPAMAERTKKKREEDPSLPSGGLEIGMKPFPPDVIERTRVTTEAVGITEADERALIGSILALIEFFQIASKTSGLQEVVMSVIDVPWWSIIRSGGKMPGLNFELVGNQPRIEAKPWALPTPSDIWAVPFVLHLNGKPALVCQLAVTAPRPPLLPCAGIIGLAASRPDGKGPILTLQIVAAHTRATSQASSGAVP